METTIIAIGDPHFKVENLPEVELFIEQIVGLCKEIKPSCIVVLGDVLDTHETLHTVPMNKAFELIQKLRDIAFTVVMVGNHDMISNQEFLTTHHWMNSMKEWNNVLVVDTVVSKKINTHDFIFCPYVYNGRFIEALSTLKEDWKKATCIFAHQEFIGCKMGAKISDEGDVWNIDYPQIVSGHIHSNQTLNNIYYCGSSLQQAFGENDNNIIPVLSWKQGSSVYELKEVNLKLPRKKIIYRDMAAISNFDFEKEQKNGNKIKLSLSGDKEEFKAFKKTKKYKDIIGSGCKVSFKDKKYFEKEKAVIALSTNLNTNSENSESDFPSILRELVLLEKNSDLLNMYEYVVNNVVRKDSEVLFI